MIAGERGVTENVYIKSKEMERVSLCSLSSNSNFSNQSNCTWNLANGDYLRCRRYKPRRLGQQTNIYTIPLNPPYYHDYIVSDKDQHQNIAETLKPRNKCFATGARALNRLVLSAPLTQSGRMLRSTFVITRTSTLGNAGLRWICIA